MKKSRIFMAAGAVVLAISAVFATKANKKFAGFSSAVTVSTEKLGSATWSAGSEIFTTTSNTHQIYAALVTASSTSHAISGQLVTLTDDGGLPVYFR